jgi:hypothetical protein
MGVIFQRASIKTVISVEVLDNDGNGKPIGTGFLLLTPNAHVVLVTAKHVITDDKGQPIRQMAYRLNDRNNKSRLVPEVHARQHAGPWFLSETADVACRLIVWGDTTEFTVSKYEQLLRKDVLKPAAPLLVPGFPLGLRSEEHTDPIVHRGNVGGWRSRISLLMPFCSPETAEALFFMYRPLGSVEVSSHHSSTRIK